MYNGAKPIHFRMAKELRKNQTPAEEALWKVLSGNTMSGFKFRRQHPISNFILDFYCHQLKLGIEIDGDIHSETMQAEYDIERTKKLDELKIEVIRFANEEVLNEISNVLNTIEFEIKKREQKSDNEPSSHVR
nr:endonuclease domain-containing protein [Bacteroidota bacterium]